MVAGYVHSVGASRFKIGQNTVLETNSPQIKRWRGSLGAFSVDPANGAAMGQLDATSPKGPYLLDEASHGAAVKEYFVGAGIPAGQIGEIQTTYMSGMMGGRMGGSCWLADAQALIQYSDDE